MLAKYVDDRELATAVIPKRNRWLEVEGNENVGI